MTPEKLAKVVADTRRRADAGQEQSAAVTLWLCQEAERLVERVMELEEELRRARSAEDIAGLSLPQVIQELQDS